MKGLAWLMCISYLLKGFKARKFVGFGLVLIEVLVYVLVLIVILAYNNTSNRKQRQLHWMVDVANGHSGAAAERNGGNRWRKLRLKQIK